METVITVAHNLTQHSPLKLVGNDDAEFWKILQSDFTIFLTFILVSLISAPFLTILVGLVMFTATKNDKNSEKDEGEDELAAMKTVPFTSFIWIFIRTCTDIPKTIEEIVKKFGPAFKINILGFIRITCINDPVMLKKLDLFMEPVHLHKPSWYHKIMPGLQKNDSTTTPAQREALLQAFNNKNLQNHLTIFEEHAEKLRLTFLEELKDYTNHNTKSTEILDRKVSECTFDSLLDISFGREMDINPKDKVQLFEHFERVKYLAAFFFDHHFILPTFLWAIHPVKWYMDSTFRQIFKIINKITENNSKTEKAETQQANIIDMSIKSLIEVMSKAGLSNEEITTEVTAFIAWGHGFIRTTLNKLMFHLADKKDYQTKCQGEINAMFHQIEKNLTKKYGIDSKALNALEFLDRCIQECLRLYPTFPLFSRNINTAVQLDKNITLPAGTNVLTCHWLLHQNPYSFPNPERFNPDRFLSEKSKNRDVYEYLSCSLGPVNCIWHQIITQQLKVFASYIIHNYELYLETRTEHLQKLMPFGMSTAEPIVKLRRRQLN